MKDVDINSVSFRVHPHAKKPCGWVFVGVVSDLQIDHARLKQRQEADGSTPN